MLTGLRGEQWYRIMRLFFQASASECSNPRLCCLLLCILPIPSSFPNPHHIHHTCSTSHLGVRCLRPRISDCHTRSFAHLGVARLCTSIPIIHLDFLYLLVAFLLHDHLPTAPPPPFSFPRVFQDGPKFFFVASWSHHTFLLRPPPSYSVSLAHTSNKLLITTHCTTVAYCCSM